MVRPCQLFSLTSWTIIFLTIPLLLAGTKSLYCVSSFCFKNHQFSANRKFSIRKLAFLTLWYAQVHVRIRKWDKVFLWKFCLRTKWMIPCIILTFQKKIQALIKIFHLMFWRLSNNINPFVPNAPFLYPMKTSENRKVFCLQRVHWEQMC